MKRLQQYFSIVLSFCTLFVSIMIYMPTIHAATYGEIITSINFRTAPSTEASIYEVLGKGSYVTMIDTSKTAGPGCSEGWYHVSYNEKNGYICSSYIKLTDSIKVSYNRPWTSPKKAIIGGAEFISDGYISAGQFTSYLKKFNVNPNGTYRVNNHQYMANLEAPYSEAKTTYNSYKNNDLLKLPFNFTIPVFENMPEKTKHSKNGEKTGGVTEVTDKEFEKALEEQEFPETYRVWLRELHKTHANWTFTSLETGLDFSSTALVQQSVGSIQQSSCSACIQNPPVRTEGNWYIANIETVSYYLDPRNFLDETSIFMFENLSYNEKTQSEEVVKSVLANTFMSGTDPLDHLPYSSIFMEAGKTYNVSPVYLASLARQEIGTKQSTATSGLNFTYEGLTYEGFYNFYNIGAYSSASNPVLAGLVYAAAGATKNSEGIYFGNVKGSSTPAQSQTTKPSVSDEKPTEESKEETKEEQKEETKPTAPEENKEEKPEQKDPTPKVTPVATHLANMGLKMKGNFITNVSLNTTVANLKQKTDSSELTFIKPNGSLLGDTEKITTGTTIQFKTGESYTVVIYGDLTADGMINSADLLKMRQYLLGKVNLTDSYLEAAKLASKQTVNSADLLRLRQFLLGQKGIDQA